MSTAVKACLSSGRDQALARAPRVSTVTDCPHGLRSFAYSISAPTLADFPRSRETEATQLQTPSCHGRRQGPRARRLESEVQAPSRLPQGSAPKDLVQVSASKPPPHNVLGEVDRCRVLFPPVSTRDGLERFPGGTCGLSFLICQMGVVLSSQPISVKIQ